MAEPLQPHATEPRDPTTRKRWLYVIPAVFITYSLAYLDRANYGFGAAAGMAATLHITGKQSSLLSGLFFLGYFTFQIPGATLARKFKISRVVFIALVLWGSLAALTGVLRDFRLLALDRFLLGIAESLIFPVMLHLLTRWFTRAERSRANAILLLGNPVTVLWMSALTGILIDRFGWQRTFIFEGLPSIAWGFLWIFLVRDRPSEAAWLPAQAALLFGDAMLRRDTGELRVCPDSWTQPYGGPARLRAVLGGLTQLPVEHVLVSHGPLVLGGGLEALRDAVS